MFDLADKYINLIGAMYKNSIAIIKVGSEVIDARMVSFNA